MREYRGLGITTLQWIYGSLIVDEKGNHYIGRAIMPNPSKAMFLPSGRSNGKTLNRFVGVGFSMVIPESVGQDTGLTDMKGNKIFDGDIVHTKEFTFKGTKYEDHNYSVVFEGGCYKLKNHRTSHYLFEFTSAFHSACEVIGNIFENSNLLN